MTSLNGKDTAVVGLVGSGLVSLQTAVETLVLLLRTARNFTKESRQLVRQRLAKELQIYQ